MYVPPSLPFDLGQGLTLLRRPSQLSSPRAPRPAPLDHGQVAQDLAPAQDQDQAAAARHRHQGELVRRLCVPHPLALARSARSGADLALLAGRMRKVKCSGGASSSSPSLRTASLTLPPSSLLARRSSRLRTLHQGRRRRGPTRFGRALPLQRVERPRDGGRQGARGRARRQGQQVRLGRAGAGRGGGGAGGPERHRGGVRTCSFRRLQRVRRRRRCVPFFSSLARSCPI